MLSAIGKEHHREVRAFFERVIPAIVICIRSLPSSGGSRLRLLGDGSCGGSETRRRAKKLLQVVTDLQKTLEADMLSGLGRGRSLAPRLPTLQMPKSASYHFFLAKPREFQSQCGFQPHEFRDLFAAVTDVMHECRDVNGEYGEFENRERRKRRYKYSAEERLFIFLMYCRQYQSFARTSESGTVNWSKTSVRADFVFLRARLCAHPALMSKVAWGTPQEREAQRVQLVLAGVLPAGFEQAVFIVDGTKDVSQRSRSYDQQLRDYSHNKGHGRTHLVFSDLFGKVPALCSRPYCASPIAMCDRY